MKLRIFYLSHRLKQSKYQETMEYEDYPADMAPEAAYAELLTKRGSVLNGKSEVEVFQGIKIKVAPDQFITINSHALIDEKREKVSLAGERYIEQPLFDGITLNRCLMDSPNIGLKRRNRK